MELITSLVLGGIASKLQSERFKKMGAFVNLCIAFFACFFIAIIVNLPSFLSDGVFDYANLLNNLGIAFSASQIYYNIYFKEINYGKKK